MRPALLQVWCNVIQCKSAYRTNSTVIYVPCMFDHVRYEPFSLKNCIFGSYINENLRLKIYARMFWEPV